MLSRLKMIPNILLIRVLIFAVVVAAGSVFVAHSKFGDLIHNTIEQKINFATRSLLGEAPDLSNRVKIYAFDDQTSGVLQKHDLRLRDWQIVLSKIAERKPRSIFIDKVWSLPIGENFDRPVDDKEGKNFVETLRSFETEVSVGGSVFDRVIARREPISMDAPSYDASKIFGIETEQAAASVPSWVPNSPGVLYGPHRSISNAFKNIGQLDNAGFGRVFPFILVGENQVVPHAAILAANVDFNVSEGHLYINDVEVGVDGLGRIPVNLSHPKTYQEGLKTRSLISAVLRINRGEALEEIEADDYVVILPSMYTGHTDWTATPVGKLQGGYIPVGLLNSVISGRWLMPVGDPGVLALVFVVFGLLFGLLLPLRATLPIASMIAIVAIATSLIMFSYHDVMVPWLVPMMAFLIQVVVTFGERARLTEMQKGRLRQALEDTVPPDRLEKLVVPGVLKREATEQVVTVMFIDMVGFSLQAERLTPKSAFRDLRQNLSKMTEYIHKHGGIIDKFLGDGLLCFFGYSFTGKSSIHGHADDALNCAMEIQQEWAKWTVLLSQEKRAIYPLRIGINTASAYIGDVGRGHVHFTLIGEGVNFAKRLEAACEPYKVMLGAATKDLIQNPDVNWEGIHERPLQIKHHEDLFQSFEVNPFYGKEAPLDRAQDIIRRALPAGRIAQRWPVPPGQMWADFGIGHGEMTNYSMAGLGLLSDVYPATGVKLTLNLEARDENLNKKLKSSGLIPLICEVRWGCPLESGEKYRLGVEVRSLNPIQLERLNGILRSGLFHPEEKDAA